VKANKKKNIFDLLCDKGGHFAYYKFHSLPITSKFSLQVKFSKRGFCYIVNLNPMSETYIFHGQ
jgi:hypothetical protein